MSWTVRTLHHYSKDPAAPHHSRSRWDPAAGRGADQRREDGVRVLPLRRLHGLLRGRLERTQAMVAAVEKEMEARQMGISLTPEERFAVFGENDPSRYEAEAEERWGKTDAWAESQRKTRTYGKDDWLRVTAEGADIERRFAAALTSGVAPDSAGAMDLAEEHRQQISRNFYDCPPEVHAGLGRMYVEDERFTAHYEEIAPGLAQYVSTAVQANAARQAG
jgi:hypothetical protein